MNLDYAVMLCYTPKRDLDVLPETFVDMSEARLRLIRQLSYEIRDQRVLEVMGRVPRELFIPPASQHLAYENIPLPIDLGQTISQPFIVALMTEALELKGDEKVLEVGTGTGYQTAILAEMAKWVISVERHPKLIEQARKILTLLDYRNVEIHLAGKTLGWPSGAPYDAIIVTAAAPNASRQLLDQLAVGGSMVIPVGTPFEQQLVKVVKLKEKLQTKDLGPVRFVPLIGDDAWPRD